MGNYKFTEYQVRAAVEASYSIAGVCRELGIIAAGGNYASMKRRIERYMIDTSHFTGKGWNKENYSDTPNSKGSIKKKLIRERGHQCQKCKNKLWFGVLITLELEHVDGNNSNNCDDNLLLLCPNCHAQTKTWRRAKSSFNENPKLKCPICDGPKDRKSKSCVKCFSQRARDKSTKPARNGVPTKFCACGVGIAPRASECVKCSHVKQLVIDWPPVAELIHRLRENRESYLSVSKSLGISDNAVRNYLRRNNIDPKTFNVLVGVRTKPTGR